MAGYMTKLQGYVFEGEYKLLGNAELHNGEFALLGEEEGELGVVPAAESGADLKVMLLDNVTIYDGMEAKKFLVKENAGNVFFVENGYEPAKELEYDNANYAVKPGEYVRMHMLLPGDEFVTNYFNDVAGNPGAELEDLFAAN